MKLSNWKYIPDAEHRFFLIDPDYGEFMYFKTEAERDAASHDLIQSHCDESWSESVDQIIAGVVTHKTIRCDVQPCPKREDYISDEEFEDAMDEFGSDEHSFTCDYKLVPIAEQGDKKS